MKLEWALLFTMGIALCGCEKPCKEGFQRYGEKCVRSPVKDAGTDTSEIGSGDDDLDAGRMDVAEVDAGSAPPPPDAGKEPDSAPDAGASCYLDRDGDGVGAGSPVPCPVGQTSGDALVSKSGDCDDNDPTRSPALTDLCGDAIDNDCDGKVDDESNNACGGPCTVQLGHQPGEVCSNGLLGECERSGRYVCESGTATKCDAPTPSASAEICGDGKDNDCDGSKDEADATNATWWYQDCDGDGYAASTSGAQRACVKPANAGTCGWTAVIPDPATKSNWDCNDSLAAYAPNADYGFPPSGSTSFDLNCDGQSSPSPARPATKECSAAVVKNLNAGALECATSLTSDGCIVFKDAGGAYVDPPKTHCPDSPYLVRMSRIDPWGESGGYSCALSQRAPAWPCR